MATEGAEMQKHYRAEVRKLLSHTSSASFKITSEGLSGAGTQPTGLSCFFVYFSFFFFFSKMKDNLLEPKFKVPVTNFIFCMR